MTVISDGHARRVASDWFDGESLNRIATPDWLSFIDTGEIRFGLRSACLKNLAVVADDDSRDNDEVDELGALSSYLRFHGVRSPVAGWPDADHTPVFPPVVKVWQCRGCGGSFPWASIQVGDVLSDVRCDACVAALHGIGQLMRPAHRFARMLAFGFGKTEWKDRISMPDGESWVVHQYTDDRGGGPCEIQVTRNGSGVTVVFLHVRSVLTSIHTYRFFDDDTIDRAVAPNNASSRLWEYAVIDKSLARGATLHYDEGIVRP